MSYRIESGLDVNIVSKGIKGNCYHCHVDRGSGHYKESVIKLLEEPVHSECIINDKPDMLSYVDVVEYSKKGKIKKDTLRLPYVMNQKQISEKEMNEWIDNNKKVKE